MTKRVEYSEIADSLIPGDWFFTSYDNVNDAIKKLDQSVKAVVLLADIAKSLRVLRCQNFQNIPFKLDAIKRSVARIPKRKVKK